MEYFSLFLVLLVFIVIRIEVVYRIRIKTISKNYGLYKILPSRDTMIFNPMQWYMWTYNQYYRKYNG